MMAAWAVEADGTMTLSTIEAPGPEKVFIVSLGTKRRRHLQHRLESRAPQLATSAGTGHDCAGGCDQSPVI